MSTACALFFGKILRVCHKPLIHHVVVRGRRSDAYFTSMMRHRSLLNPYEPTHRNTHLEWNYDAELYAFANRLGEKFDKQTLETALLDRSYVQSQVKKQEEAGLKPKGTVEDNSRLADTGRTIVRCTVDRYLRTVIPKYPDDGIRAIVEHFSSDQVGLDVAKGLGLDELVLTPDFPVPEEVTLKGFYAVIGAVHESTGIERAATFVRDLIVAKLHNVDVNEFWMPEDPLNYLNALLKKEGQTSVEPRLIHQCGMNTLLASYRVGLYLDREYLGAGNGESVEEAVKLAAMDVLWRMWGTRDGALYIPLNVDPKVFLKTSSPLPLIENERSQSGLSETAVA